MMYDLFISYSREDKAFVHDFVKQLQNKGFSIWIDWTGIKSGDKFKAEIVQAIEESIVVLFFSSISSNVSVWVQKEISIASSRNKVIIPIKLDNSPYDKNIELDLALFDFVDFSNNRDRKIKFDKLVRSIWIHISIKENFSNNNTENKNEIKVDNPINNKIKNTLYIIILIIVVLFISIEAYNFIDNHEHKRRLDTAEVELAEAKAKTEKAKAERAEAEARIILIREKYLLINYESIHSNSKESEDISKSTEVIDNNISKEEPFF